MEHSPRSPTGTRPPDGESLTREPNYLSFHTFRTRHLRLLALALAFAWVSPSLAGAAPASPEYPFVLVSAATAPEASVAKAGLRVRLDAEVTRRLRESSQARVLVPLAADSEVELALVRFDLLEPGVVVTATGDAGSVPVHPDVVLFRGSVVGDPESWVVIGVSSDDALGVISTQGRLVGIGPIRERGASSGPLLHSIAEVSDPPAGSRRFECLADQLAGEALEVPRSPRGGGVALEATTTRLRCDIAVDCDYELYSIKFGGDLTATTNYVLTVMGVASAIYERDINTTLMVSYLNVWTTATDPYSSTTTSAQLPQFRNFWNANRGTVSRDLAHLLSGRGLGGGIAYLGVLCNLSSGYAVSAIDTGFEYPANGATWDANVIAHETGHNFSSPHTQSCFWQSAGYVAPGALLDSCYAAEGSCYTGPVGILPPNLGTLMSYCHLIAGVAGGIRMEFHPACRTEMRTHAENCLSATALQPPTALAATVASWTVNLNWSPSPSAGITGYELHGGAFSADPAPPLIALGTGLSFVDENVLGPRYYKVLATTASGLTPYSAEIVASVPCTPVGPEIVPAGSTPGALVVSDFNEDGILDLAVSNLTAAGSVSILPGAGTAGVGNGLFGLRVGYASNPKPIAMAAADVNQDGITDLVAVNDATAGTYSVLLGLGSGGVGDGTFAAPTSGASGQNPKALVVRDFDEDGLLDLAVANSGSHTVTIHGGLGTDGVDAGSFALPTSYAVGIQPVSLASGDFDEDGILDLAVACKSAGTVEVLLGNGTAGVGDGTFAAPAAYAAGMNASGLVTGDFDEDGITDLATLFVSLSGTNVGVLRGLGAAGVGNGTFGAVAGFPCGSAATLLAVADVNGNGVADLLVGSTGSGGVLNVLLGIGAGGVGNGTFAEPYPAPVGVGVQGLALGDFKEDGFPDWVVAGGSSTARLFYGSCAPVQSAALAVVAPNGGETWTLGSEETIRWTRGPAIAAVTVELSRDGGTSWETLASDMTASSLAWTVTPPAVGTTARVRVSDSASPTRSDASDAPFQIIGSGVLAAPDAPARRLALAHVAARGSREGVGVAFDLPGDGAATLVLVDVTGRSLAAREVGSLGQGRHEVVFTPSREAPSGIYWVVLSRAGERVSRKVALLK